MTANYARLCFQYSGAVALLKGSVGLDEFTDTALTDERVAALAPKISVAVNHITDPAAFTPQRATATLTTGETVTAETRDALFGSPGDPLTEAQNIEKFRACVRFGFGAPQPELEDRLIAHVDALETLADVAVLARLSAGLETQP